MRPWIFSSPFQMLAVIALCAAMLSFLPGCALTGSGKLTPATASATQRTLDSPQPAEVMVERRTTQPDGAVIEEGVTIRYNAAARSIETRTSTSATSAGLEGSGIKDAKIGPAVSDLEGATGGAILTHMFPPQFSLPSAYYIGCILTIIAGGILAYVRQSLAYLLLCALGAALIVLGSFVSAYPLLAFGIFGAIGLIVAVDVIYKLKQGATTGTAVKSMWEQLASLPEELRDSVYQVFKEHDASAAIKKTSGGKL